MDHIGVTIVPENCYDDPLEYLDSMNYAVNELKASALQIFFGQPSSPQRKEMDHNKLKKIKEFINKNNVYLVIHASFALNFCKQLKENKFALHNFLNDLKNAYYSGASGCVLHMGFFFTKNMKIPYLQGIDNMVESIKYVIEKLIKLKIDPFIILETPAKISEICHTFEHFKILYDKFTNIEKKYVRFCIDTAHLHSSGYDIRSLEDAKNVLNHWDTLIGLDNVEVIHFNDSQQLIGSNIDQHHAIGFGYIGNKKMGGDISGLRYIAQVAKEKGIPIIQETKDPDHKKRIKMIRNW